MQIPNTTPVDRRAFPVRGAAEWLSVSESYIWKMARNGKIKLTRVGGRTLIFSEDLERFIAEMRASS